MSLPVLVSLRTINSVLALLNISANSFLIFALKKTRQTESISLQLICLMSVSDLMTGVGALSLTNILLWGEDESYCYIRNLTQFVHILFAGFSIWTVFLVALDRFLHMKFLLRYPIIMTKRRGYAMIVGAFSYSLLAAVLFSMPFAKEAMEILQLVLFLFVIVIMVTILVLYYKVCKTVRSRISTTNKHRTHQTMNQCKRLSKAAALITICLATLTTPLVISHVILALNRHHKIVDENTFVHFKWFCYVGVLGNGFCSSIIFILHNKPSKHLLQSIALRICNCTVFGNLGTSNRISFFTDRTISQSIAL